MAAAIDEKDLTALRALAFANKRFEPFPVAILPPGTLDRLIRAGWAEAGQSCRPAVGRTGYRLTEAGWDMVSEHWTRHAGPELIAV